MRVRESESVYECVRVARVLARSRASRNMSTTSLKHKEITRFVAVGSRSRGRASACVCVCIASTVVTATAAYRPSLRREEEEQNYKLFS